MAYEPTNWENGDVITAEKLNKIENGIVNGSGMFVVHITADQKYSQFISDVSYQDIEDALDADKFIFTIISQEIDGEIANRTIGVFNTNYIYYGNYIASFYIPAAGSAIEVSSDTATSLLIHQN